GTPGTWAAALHDSVHWPALQCPIGRTAGDASVRRHRFELEPPATGAFLFTRLGCSLPALNLDGAKQSLTTRVSPHSLQFVGVRAQPVIGTGALLVAHCQLFAARPVASNRLLSLLGQCLISAK